MGCNDRVLRSTLCRNINDNLVIFFYDNGYTDSDIFLNSMQLLYFASLKVVFFS